MKTTPDPLDDLLARRSDLDAAAFTQRVLAALPPRRRDPRGVVLGTSVAVAAAVGAVSLPGLSRMLAVLATQPAAPSTWLASGLPALVALAFAAHNLLAET